MIAAGAVRLYRFHRGSTEDLRNPRAGRDSRHARKNYNRVLVLFRFREGKHRSILLRS